MLKDLQRRIYANKAAKGFNTTADEDGINREICFLAEELGELARSHRRGNRAGVVDAVSDLLVYCLGLYEILEVDGDAELERVLADIESRGYEPNPSGQLTRTVAAFR
jgi:NTP pyrophosphatase (non-canonical NTP hydrolase)